VRIGVAGVALTLLSGVSFAAVPGLAGGHAKGRWLTATYPDDSLFREVAGPVTQDQLGSLRLKFRASPGPLQVEADYQLLGRHGDQLALSRELEDLFLLPPAVPDDDHRWWDLTTEISSGNDTVLLHRLDRLNLSWSGARTVLRFGRQAVSWGNGLIYNPMDFFNPLDPAAIDTEYKVGDDMLYGQYLTDAGNDWQLVNVQRRDERGDVTSAVSSTALKYHHFGLDREFDLLLARHFEDTVLGAGGLLNVGEAVLRGDLVLTDTDRDEVASLVVNWSYSWTWGGYNVSGVAEYFFNGFGLRESEYSPADIIAAEDLVARIRRGELFTLGRHYLAGSLMVELSPLVNLSPSLFVNLGDRSALAQLVLQWDLAQDWQVLGAVNLPVGPAGTEYGGLDSGVAGLTLGTGPGVFAQVAFYF
jgi:hypothetical protein